MRPALLTLLLALGAAPPLVEAQAMRSSSSLRFEVHLAPGLVDGPQDGRLFVILGRKAHPEPRLVAGHPGLDAPPMFARDVQGFAPGSPGIIDAGAVGFPIEDLSRLPAGPYVAQAVFERNNDRKMLNAPGNLFSEPRRVRLDPARGGTVTLDLTRAVPPEALPPDTDWIKYIKIRSDRLSAFHGRPIFLRAAVILPRDFDREPERCYPLRVHIGGFGSPYTEVPPVEVEGSAFRHAWLADDTPRMILLKLDGAGPLGDPYQVNSANHGPYGDAITSELIPFVERHFRALGEPYARVLDGGSTGGWVALALQVFYPDFFNGCWAFCPDSVDFRSFQLLNIYQDKNAYLNEHGFERPAARDTDGDIRYTMRHECQLENVLGRGDSWAMSGGQWGAWNATYGPRGPDGRPVPLWDPKTGRIDRDAAEHWKKYDLRLVLQENWKTLGPKLRGKIHIWVGEADDFFLNNAVHRLDAFLSRANPPFEGTIVYGPGQGHCWMGLSERELMLQMAAAIAAGRG
ncbi:MAG: hypothetical protein IRY99_17955, partial [Isosphaeraceae bacterium]|nr:hypothetical protein [Isosphaeraceae bacterium]